MNFGQVVVGLAHAAKERPGVVLAKCPAANGAEDLVVIFETGQPAPPGVQSIFVELPSGWAKALGLTKPTYFRADSIARCKPSDLRIVAGARCPNVLLVRLQGLLNDLVKDEVAAVQANIPPLEDIVRQALAKQESRRP